MQTKLIQLGANIIEAVGINVLKENRPNSKVWKFIVGFTCHLSIDVLAFMVSITNTDDFSKFVSPIPYIAPSVVVQGGIFFIYYYRKIVSHLLYEMDKKFYIYPDEHSLKIDYAWYLQEENIVILVTLTKYASLGVIFVLSIPVIGEIIYYGRIKTFIYPVWAPWNMDNLMVELIVFVVQFVQGFWGLWFNYVFMTFLFISVAEFMRQYQRLTFAVESLECRSSQQVVEDGSFDGVLRQNIIHCIRHHQILLKNFRLFEIWFSMIFSIELAVSVVAFTFALYLAMNVSNLSQLINGFQAASFIWMSFLLRCLISEIFPRLNERLAESLFWHSPWHRVSKKNRKLLQIFHSTACHPLRLYGLSVFEATRVTFGRLIRTTYSFFNVMKRNQ